MELSAIEQRVANDRRAAKDRTPDNELRLAGTLYEFAEALIATKDGDSHNRWATAVEPAQEAVLIRLHWLTAGMVSAQFAGQLQDALRLLERAARVMGHRELATGTIRDACQAYRQVARTHPHAAGICADGLAKCGVWLCRLDSAAAVSASSDAVTIRAGLFAHDPTQASRYLASLSTLLRTLMVGRSRKAAIARYREHYARLTTPTMTAALRALPCTDLGLTSKTVRTLQAMNCTTLERAGHLTQQQILFHSAGDLATIEEINWPLALLGYKPLAAGALPDPPAKPVHIATSFGALAIRCTASNAVDAVRAAVIAAYAADGAHPVPVTTFGGVTQPHWGTAEPHTNTALTLGDDLVLLEQLSGSWVSVASLHWEITPVGRHPLALRLSKSWPVISVTTVEQLSYELCWYTDGAPSQYAGLGRAVETMPLQTPLAPLNFATLADYGADYASETQVRAAFGNTAMFTKLTELPAQGIRQAAEAGPLTGYGDHVLAFARRAPESTDPR